MIESAKADGKTELSGSDAFRLYDTYGFPFELTLEIAEEKGYTVDEEGFKTFFENNKICVNKEDNVVNILSKFEGLSKTIFDKIQLNIR